MFLKRLNSPARAIKLNVLADAFVTSFLTAAVGYLTAQSGIDGQDSLRAVSIGIVIGTALSLPLARLGDVVGETKVLTGIQILQVLTYIALGVVPASMWLLGVLIGAFLLGRFVSPLRGALPPRYLQKDELISFKVALRTSTLTVVLIGAAAVPCVLYMGIPIRNAASAIGVLGYVACIFSTQVLHATPATKNERPQAVIGWVHLDADIWRSWLSVVLACAVIATGSALIPYILAAKGSAYSWLLVCSLLVEIVINYVIQKSARFGEEHGPPIRFLLIASVSLGVCGLLLLVVGALLEVSALVFSAVLIAAFCVSHTAQTFAIIMAWQLQYEKGADKDRAFIVAVFSMASSFGVGVANFSGAAIYDALGI